MGCWASSIGISVQVLLPGDTSLNFTNLRVWALWEASHTERNTDASHCSPEELKGSILGPLVLGSWDGWLKSLIYFHPGCSLGITGIYEIPVRMVLLHLSCFSDKEHSRAVRGDWLFLLSSPTLIRQQEFLVRSVLPPTFDFQEFPVCFTTNLLWKGLSRLEERWGGIDHSHLLSSLPNKNMVGLQGDEASPLHRPCSLVSQLLSWSVVQLVSFEHLKNWIWASHIPCCCDYKKSNPTLMCASNKKSSKGIFEIKKRQLNSRERLQEKTQFSTEVKPLRSTGYPASENPSIILGGHLFSVWWVYLHNVSTPGIITGRIDTEIFSRIIASNRRINSFFWHLMGLLSEQQ